MREKLIKAEIAVLKTQESAIENGIISCRAPEGARYDLILDKNGKLYKCQVKYAGRYGKSKGAVSASLTKHEGRGCIHPYTSEEIDILAVYVAPSNEVCWFGPAMFVGKKTIQIRFEDSRNNQTKNCILSKNYIAPMV